MIKTDINNLKTTLTQKQFNSFNNTKIRLQDKTIVTGLEYLKSLLEAGYKITEGKGNSYTLRSENNNISVQINAVEAKVFNVLQKGGKGDIYRNGYNIYNIR